ncbi:MAG: glutamine--fructose-6-phosphate transaminase (isomerizing) [Gammaproteobacteria bacterium]
MCGIVGAVSQRDVTSILVEGLRRLEYRGYDSAGIAVLENGQLVRRRVKGKVRELINLVASEPVQGKTGIAHTRWATHGVPSEDNAHPHVSHDEIAVVHNGIIENHEQLREELLKEGYQFQSQTDTEVIAHLIYYYIRDTNDFLTAVRKATQRLEGAYALGIIYKQKPDQIIGVRRGSPLVVGLSNKENFIASDAHALLPVTQNFVYLEEGDMALISREQVQIYDIKNNQVIRETHHLENNHHASERGNYKHFMQKEIYEQPEAVAATLEGRLSKNKVLEASFGIKAPEIFKKVKRVTIIACGTSYHAGCVSRYWLEELAGIPCHVEIASEYRYRTAVVEDDTLFIAISQSGETADTLAALRLAKEQRYLATLGICNVPSSTLVREADLTIMTRAGIEVGVASTKAFTTQLTILLILTIALGRGKKITSMQEEELVGDLHQLPASMEQVLACEETIEKLAKNFADKQHALFLGRGPEYPVALEGALKLKEISYIHAEAYPAGELKHGPLALVDKNMPVIAIMPKNGLLEKLKSNIEEVSARGGELYLFTDDSVKLNSHENIHKISLPAVPAVLVPIVYTIPLQLLAYHVAVIKGTDIDQPRNLAKSVTVE